MTETLTTFLNHNPGSTSFLRALVRGGVLLSLGALVIASGPADVRAQEATERFIPIGQSPGLSGRYTVIGTISAVDLESRILTVTSESGTLSVRLSERTMIWLDRSELRLTNLRGTPADCRAGVRVEVRYQDDDRDRPAHWIKLGVTSPPSD